MITSLRVTNFRAFESMTVEDLAPVNLFVGKNGCGKTSVLEAAALLATEGNPTTMFRIAAARGESVKRLQDESLVTEYALSHQFHGHKLEVGSFFEIAGENGEPVKIRCEGADINRYPGHGSSKDDVLEKDCFGRPLSLAAPLCLAVERSSHETPLLIALSPFGGTDPTPLIRFDIPGREPDRPVCFLPTDGLSAREMSFRWDGVVLTEEEGLATDALRVLEPGIERIASLGGKGQGDRLSEGMYAKLKGSDSRLPLGSLGDGIKRLLGLSLTVIQSAGGYTMIDEIDTGLHHSVMPKMWEMIIRTAERLNVQVFATTHSQDCVNGLATLHRDSPEICESVRVHRIEPDLGKAVSYSPAEISIAEEHRVEVR